MGHAVDKLLNLSSQLLNQLDSIATSLAIIARAVQEIAAETAYLDD